jgi:hypothetical protein
MTRGGDIRFLIDTLFNVRYLRLSQGRHQRATFVYTITVGCRFPYSSCQVHVTHAAFKALGWRNGLYAEQRQHRLVQLYSVPACVRKEAPGPTLAYAGADSEPSASSAVGSGRFWPRAGGCTAQLCELYACLGQHALLQPWVVTQVACTRSLVGILRIRK